MRPDVAFAIDAPAVPAPRAGKRLKILFVAKRFPYPADTGGKIRTARLLETLSRDVDLTLVSNVEHPVDDPYLGEVPKLCSRFEGVPWTEVRKSTPAFYARVLRHTLSRYPVSVVGDHAPAFAARIAALLAREPWDLVVCDFVQPTVNLPDAVPCPVVVFQHNVESTIFRRHAETARHPLLRRFWTAQWRKMERFERAACRRYAGVVAVSEADRAVFAGPFGAPRAFAIPTAVDAAAFRPAPGSESGPALVFTGSMDWLPNEDAVLFFADGMLDDIRARVPGVTLTVVGRNPSARLRRRLRSHPAVTVTGRVDDVRPWIAGAAVYVVPLRIGGGTRIKVYEAMAMGKAVVSTTVGAEGLPVRHDQHLLLADGPHRFAEAVVGLLRDAPRRERLGRAARRFVERHASWESAAAAFRHACEAIVADARSRTC